MTAFSIVAALMVLVALLFVLPGLLRKPRSEADVLARDVVNLAVLRDQLRELDVDMAAGTIDATGYESARRELEMRVVEDIQPGAAGAESSPPGRRTAIAVALAVPLLAGALYFVFGSPAGLNPDNLAQPKDQPHEVTAERLEGMVAKLAQRMKSRPDDAEGWNMLARSYNALGRFGDAVQAYEHLVVLVPRDADLLADYADTLAMAQNKSLQGEPEKLIERALTIDPKNVKALALAGSASFERHDYQAAITQWKRLLPLVPADSDIAKSTVSGIAEAQNLAGEPASAPATMAAATGAAPAAAAVSPADAQVSGTVELDPALRAKVADTDTVFIYARAVEGPRFPLAVLRKQVKDLPVKFVLDDSMSMMPTAKLSGFPMVLVGARISKSGSATPGAGDLEGITGAVRPGAKDLQIRIASERK